MKKEISDGNNDLAKKGKKVMKQLTFGAIAGVCAKTVIAPDIIKNEGVTGLWKGHSANIARVAPYAGCHYAIHDFMESHFRDKESGKITPFNQFLCGSAAGGGATMLTYPLDVIRVRIAFETNNGIAEGLSRSTPWTRAIAGGKLYSGFVPTMLGVVPYAGTAWTAKRYLQDLYPSISHHPLNPMELFVINITAGLLGQLITYPLDVVRRRMQIIRSANELPFDTMRRTVYHLYKTEGWRGLAKGYSLNIIKGPITLGISLTVYDELHKWVE